MELFLLLSDLQSKNFFYKKFQKRIQNWFEIQEIELSKQEMELFLLLLDLQSKNFFYKKFLTFRNESKTGFENRK